MDTQLKSNPYIVEHLLYPGLYIIAGAPKIGKSWLALDLCLSVAEGEPFLKHETHRGQVLYLALEDSLLRFGVMHRAVRERGKLGGMKMMQEKGQSPFRRSARPLRRAKPAAIAICVY